MPDWNKVERTMQAAKGAATRALQDAGIEPDAIVVNVVWSEGEGQWAAGSRVPETASSLLTDSLYESASEAASIVEASDTVEVRA